MKTYVSYLCRIGCFCFGKVIRDGLKIGFYCWIAWMLVCESELVISYFSPNIVERSTSSFIFILGVSEKNEVKTNTSLLVKSSLWISVCRMTLNNLPSNQNYHVQIPKNPMQTLVFFHSHLPIRFCFSLSQQSHICKENCDNFLRRKPVKICTYSFHLSNHFIKFHHFFFFNFSVLFFALHDLESYPDHYSPENSSVCFIVATAS